MIAHAIDGKDIERNGTVLQLSTLVTPLVYPCADGEVVPHRHVGDARRPDAVDGRERRRRPQEWVDAEDWDTYEVRMLTGRRARPLAARTCARRSPRSRCSTRKAELFEGGIARGVTLAPVNTVADVLSLEQLAVRDYWDEVALPSGRTLRTPGPFVKASATPVAWTRPAPDVGEHTREVLAALDAPRRRGSHVRERPASAIGCRSRASRSPTSRGSASGRSRPRRSPTTAPPSSTSRATSPADRLRLVGPFKDGIPGINRCQFFGVVQHVQAVAAAEPEAPDRPRHRPRLLAWCDIALDSFTAGTMAELGLGYDVARELNPGIIMATTCLLGQYGPAAKLAGYGYHAAAVSGFYEITGWDDRPPAGPFNAYTDTIAPRFLTTALLAALDHRRRTGEGQFIDQAQMESALHFLAPSCSTSRCRARAPAAPATTTRTHAPHDAYPCAGDDEWCAIAVETDEQWRALRGVLGDAGVGAGPGARHGGRAPAPTAT